ncbi:MAG: hypothetical protein QOG10_4711 [Kribbellaceae bacterium]|jgi:hypothetical protein|nr:hypothetical protein [Kribbellaceae bacterium]
MSDSRCAGRAGIVQGTAEHLAHLLQGLLGQSYDEFESLAIDEDYNIVMTPDQAWLLYELAAKVSPHCLTIPGQPAQEGCQMPTGICHECAATGRSLPASHPLRATNG